MPVILDDVTLGDIDRCAEIACASEIGLRYGFEREALAARMREALISGAIMIAARETDVPGGHMSAASSRRVAATTDIGGVAPISSLAGFAWVDPRGAFGSSPYLKLIAVDESKRGGGTGAALLAEYERRTAEIGRVWTLMVSDFNANAIRFYENHGYVRAGAMEGFAREGITELLMVKRRT